MMTERQKDSSGAGSGTTIAESPASASDVLHL